MAMLPFVAFLLLSAVPTTEAVTAKAKAQAQLHMNPIRKVVMMLQNMQIKIAAEGEKKEKMYDKFMCYCKNGDAALAKSIADAEEKIPQLESSIKGEVAERKQLEADLKTASESRKEAKEAMAKATAIREKEKKEYDHYKADADANIAALDKAIPAIEKGMGSSFLQTETGTVSVLRHLSVSMDMNSADRDLLSAFLEDGSQDTYAPRSGEILGILKQMKEEMEKDLADATQVENEAIASYEALMGAKRKEVTALTKEIEVKTSRVGEISVAIAETENDLEDTKEGLEEDKKFLADLDKNCELKKKEWEAYKTLEQQEQVAIADTIKVLNDDDALDLFKKTLPSASSFMQLQVTSKSLRKRALHALRSVHGDPRIDFVQVALHGGKGGFDKIIGMIDGLMATLAKEQETDDQKKEYCLSEIDKHEDTEKELKLDIKDLDKAIADGKEAIETLAKEIEALIDGIKSLDESVKEATEQRQEEHADYVHAMQQDATAKEVLEFAKNRLNKFYNPKLYEPPAKRALSEEDQIVVNMGGTLAPTNAPGGVAGTGIGLVQAAPPPPPKANLSFKKSNEESNGVLAMIDLLVADLDKEMQTSKVEEEDAQKDYEKMVKDSAAKRALDSKAITDKESAKAETEAKVQDLEENQKEKTKELMETLEYLHGLHQECDWLLKFFDTRKEARANEVDALSKAKDVLNGADYSLVQTGSVVHRLRGKHHA